ncbi:unnamed protein product [Rotaria socialis]|uniref:Poly [ADP-ribose] polymerase n=3 Tax=Rotaria socialis TaxID=392032 RepID=A0A817QJ31_9BILA|nr:unnamed protein product [Rotaria socialis]
MVCFKAPTTNKDKSNVNDIIDKDLLESLTSHDKNVDVSPEYVEPNKALQPELTQDEKQKLKELIHRIGELQKELDHQKDYEKHLKDLEKKITTQTKYVTKPPVAMQTYLLGKDELITKHLNDQQTLPDYYVYKIPRLFFYGQESQYNASLIGLPTHHHEFELVLQRISYLSQETEYVKYMYKREAAETVQSVIKIIIKPEKPLQSSQTWQHYTNCFMQILKDKKQQHIEHFDEYITNKSKLLTDQVITDTNFKPRPELEKNVVHYKKSNLFTDEMEKIKYEAFVEFIKQQIFPSQQQVDKELSKESIKVLNDFIKKKKEELRTERIYEGLNAKHFQLISKLLQRITLYYHCFQLQLPLFESAPDLLKKIDENTVIAISTSTGSGKSTLLPALLIAEGYDRVLVTQPRRLPCTSICDRVNSTMTSNEDSERIAGWAVSGDEHDIKSPILYLTDGLLKEQLLHDEDLITDQTKLNKSIVFFLDEIHERSINIDLCLALLVRLLTKKPYLQSKMKLVISSATLDSSVPALFLQKIKMLRFGEFKMPKLGTLYPVKKHKRPNDNLITLVQELNKKRQRNEQILCFVSSTAEALRGPRLLQEVSSGAIIAYSLIQSQSATEQQMNIEHGSIFFSTTVAETSLTFPSLRYVIDTGMVKIPKYDLKMKQTVLEKVRVAESTIKQRLGRLGRTQPGDYYALYDFKVDEKKFPTAQICQSELTTIELSLRKSPAQEDLNKIKKFLPDEPPQAAIDMALAKLRRVGVVNPAPDESFTKDGDGIAKLPDLGSVEMSKAVFSALTRYKCGRDLIAIASVLGVLNTSDVLSTLPKRYKSTDGDFMTLLNVMNEVLEAEKSMGPRQFKLQQFCQQKGLEKAYQTLNQACRRYKTLEKSFSISKDYRNQAQIQSGKWESIAKALLEGYSDNVFVSLKELQLRKHQYTCYQSSEPDVEVAVLDSHSTLNRSINSAPVSLIVTRDILRTSSVRAKAILSFVGEIKPSWIQYEVERKIKLNDTEQEKLNTENILSTAKRIFPDAHVELNHNVLSINGSSGSVLKFELFVLQKLVEDMVFSLSSHAPPNSEAHETFQRNTQGILKMLHIFNPMKWRWENEAQVKINVEQSPTDQLKITVSGRNSNNRLVREEFLELSVWLRNCVVIRTPNSGLPPRLLIPQVRHRYLDIEERISHVTDSKRTTIDLWNGLEGPKATRETRMEVVAWFAVCQFGCKLEGGFVRDWIVGHYIQRPEGQHADPSTWISRTPNAAGVQLPILNNAVTPADLDCHLSAFKYFDIDKFLDAMHKYQIECEVTREQWRYILLFDEHAKTGPFMMDLIEPHVALTHDRVDFDVNNLSLEKDYTKELGMRVDIESVPYSIELETIVDRIRRKELKILRPSDDLLEKRLKKMVNVRHWSVKDPSVYVIPKPPNKYLVALAPIPPSSDLYKDLVKQLQVIPNIQIIKMEIIRNPGTEDLYLGMKKLIQKQLKDGNVNEKELFHGTTGKGIDGIRDYGYDNRYYGANTAKGDWGHGTYFSPNPGSHPHSHTAPNDQDQSRVLYYNKVLLGRIYEMNKLDRELQSAPVKFHSVYGTHPGRPDDDEYIIYWYGQALPYIKITYKA